MAVALERIWGLRALWSLYGHRHMFQMLVLGFCSGLTFLITLSTLNLWMIEEGISKSTVGLLGLLHLPYSLKFVCAPFIEQHPFPYLSRRLGHRRGWAVGSQMMLILLLSLLAYCHPQRDAAWMFFLAFLVACAKACQDVVLYACQVEILHPKEHTAGATCMIMGYRLGMLVSGAGAIYIAAFSSWKTAYMAMAGFVGLGLFYMLTIPEPSQKSLSQESCVAMRDMGFCPEAPWWERSLKAFQIPFRLLFSYPCPWALIFFLTTFKLGDSLCHFMANAYYLELGYSKAEIGTVVKTFGMFASLAGGVMAGVMERQWGMRTTFFLVSSAHMFSLFCMIVMGMVGYHMPTFYATIAFENGTNGMAMSLFIAYLYRFSPTPYASVLYPFFWALHAISRDIGNTFSGFLADTMGWNAFFTLCSLVSLPSLFVFAFITRCISDPEQCLKSCRS